MLQGRLLLHHTSAERDLHIRCSVLETVQIAQPAVDAVVRVLPHGAGVVDDKIRLLGLHRHVADLAEHAAELFRVARIHLAAEGDHAEGQRTLRRAALLAEQPGGEIQIVSLAQGFLCRRRRLMYHRSVSLPGFLSL